MSKKIIAIVLITFNLLLFTNNVQAQKGKITSAQLSLQDGKVMDAKRDIDAALQDPDVQKMVKAWNTKGDVYKSIYETKLFYAQNPSSLFEAKDAYMKAYELETNPKKQKDYAAPLTSLEGYLFNEGLERFNNKKFDDAYRHFDASMAINNFLFTKGLSATLDTNVIYATAMAGTNLNKIAEIRPLLEMLVVMNYDNVLVYETLAQVYDAQKDKEALSKLITKGLAKFPDNKNLQVYELNATLDNGDARQSIQKFELAAAKDPTNSSILFNLAVLYDKTQNTDRAKEYYEKAIVLKPDYGDAYFNLGVIYFNAGVELNKKMNLLDDKEDKDGKKYDAFKKQRDELFQKALPNLEKAYSIDPKNKDYRSSLKKVYASMNMLDKAKELGDQ
ncbi:MAG: Tetratricopeptide 1 repeat-containing protein [Bacteroidota bacterium]|nr:Tetratricopeptide 1 repeat-containing protein [Bacteroidota bacterium]